jgi:hypothetical protein
MIVSLPSSTGTSFHWSRGKILPRRVDKSLEEISQGGDMDVKGIGAVAGPHAPATVQPVDKAAQTRDVVQAVKALNGAEMFGPENELLFQKDPQSKTMVVRLVNRKTREVIAQAPPEYVLRLAQDVRKPPVR